MNESYLHSDISDPIGLAREIHYAQGLSWSQTKYALVESGISEIQAREIVATLEEQEYEEQRAHEYNEVIRQAQMEAKAQQIYEEEMTNPQIATERADKKIKYGWFWILGGVLLTVITQGMVIWWGAVLYGIIRICSGVRDKNIIENNQNK